jgi:hypothetical protein
MQLVTTFFVTWYLSLSDFPPSQHYDEFIADRFIEDIMDGQNSIALVVEEVKIPDLGPRATTPTGNVGVVFKVTTTEHQAKQLIELGYKVRPEHPDQMKTKWDDESGGMTWIDFTSILRGTLPVSDEKAWEQEVRATDDNDPHSPWFKVLGIKHDDDGIFLAIEEIQP